MTRVLVIDNYDSFVYTLNGYLQELGAETMVIRNDFWAEKELRERLDAEFDAVLVSPGPGSPGRAGLSIDTVKIAEKLGKPLLGVCLGHQAIAEAFGAVVSSAPELMHGKTSLVEHVEVPVFSGVPNPFTATRYHSLAIEPETVPDCLEVTARTVNTGVIMGIQHKYAPIVGVQFHPESVMTEGGYLMIGNWLESCGLIGAAEHAKGLSALPAGIYQRD